LTTTRAGAADLIKNGENGLVVDAGNAGALTDLFIWADGHRDELQRMRSAALRVAADNRWCDYRRKLIEVLDAGVSPEDAGLGRSGFETWRRRKE
jgi:glycosyltransferase involved in cell wall biosynthesis